MDVVLNYLDFHIFTPYVYPATWKEDDAWRQIASLLIVANLGGYLLYFIVASLSYVFLFDKRLLKHPQALENQVRKEITCTVIAVPFMSIPTVALFFLEVRGFSRLYDNVGETWHGYAGVFISMFLFIAFTDMSIYWIHRFLHHKFVYKHLHKIHHKWKIPSPFASHAFHPLDGFMQSIPYHLYPFLFPLHKITYLGLFVFVNIWTVSIHDGNYQVPNFLKPIINGSAHHMDHHIFYNFNYGQFFTLWDWIGGSFRTPSSFEGCGPLDQILAKEKEVAQKMNGSHERLSNGVAHAMNGSYESLRNGVAHKMNGSYEPVKNGVAQKVNGFHEPANNGVAQKVNGSYDSAKNGVAQKVNGFHEPARNGVAQKMNGSYEPVSNHKVKKMD